MGPLVTPLMGPLVGPLVGRVSLSPALCVAWGVVKKLLNPQELGGCRKAWMYAKECREHLGTDPSQMGNLNPLFVRRVLAREGSGIRPSQSPSAMGIRLCFVRPKFPLNCASLPGLHWRCLL